MPGGIYIHIPFCKSKCSYCDFCSIAVKNYIPQFLQALNNEFISKSQNYKNIEFSSIYFGGGTPSILKIEEINQIFETLTKHYQFSVGCEISFEANPDDLSIKYLKTLKQTPINRLSIGLQNLDDNILKIMRRRHTAKDAIESILNSASIGFSNISADIIYGIFGMTNKIFENQLKEICSLPINHISAYHLGIEKATLLYRMLKEKKFFEIDDAQSFEQYQILINILLEKGFEQYEISNFAKNKMISKHNSSYWNSSLYLGFGPSAHSFNGKQRFYNTSNIKKYIDLGLRNIFSLEHENLSANDIINERLMLSLRTTNGLNLEDFKNEFGEKEFSRLNASISKLNKDWFLISQNYLKLNTKGMFVSDNILTKLFK